MKKITLQIGLILFFIFVPVMYAMSQPPPPPTEPIPIDGGLVFLLIAGVSVAIRQMFFNKKKNN